MRNKLQVKENGVLVSQVEAGPAQKAGVRRGDVILMMNNIDVIDTNQFNTLVTDLPVGKSVPLLVQRRGSPVFLALKVSADG